MIELLSLCFIFVFAVDIRAAFMRTPSIAEGLGGGNAAISLFPGYLYMC